MEGPDGVTVRFSHHTYDERQPPLGLCRPQAKTGTAAHLYPAGGRERLARKRVRLDCEGLELVAAAAFVDHRAPADDQAAWQERHPVDGRVGRAERDGAEVHVVAVDV